LGIPIWLEAEERFASAESVHRLMVAQDTGGAIKSPVRGDIFWGTGKAAASRAGIMKARGRYYLLLPRSVASRLAPELVIAPESVVSGARIDLPAR
jgi:membrane-bound lytic murein transglycosylase A